MEASAAIGRLAALVCAGDEVDVDDLRAALAASIDLSLLDPLAGPERVAQWACAHADAGYAALYVQPCNAARVAWELGRLGSSTPAGTVLSFPQGQASPEELCFQVALMLAAGVGELDVVLNCGAYLEGSYDEAFGPVVAALQTIDADEGEGAEDGECTCGEHAHDEACCSCGDPDCSGECGCDDPDCSCHDHGRDDAPVLKVVLETGWLTGEHVCQATDIASSLGVDFVAAATGFGSRGATVEDVRLMCATVEPGVQVKATGDVRTLDDALALLEAGATRIGTAYGDEILADFDAAVAALGL